jgi:CHASE3 domain sensor protein
MASNNKEKVSEQADHIESKVQEGADKVNSKVQEGANKAQEVLEDDDVQKAARRAEEEVNRLKTELADLRRKAGPKIQEAENYLTSPSAITFYKGLITGVAVVLAYKKYSERRF